MKRGIGASGQERLYYDLNGYSRSNELEMVCTQYNLERRRYPSILLAEDEHIARRVYEALLRRVQHEKLVVTKYPRFFEGVCAQDPPVGFEDDVTEVHALEAIVKHVGLPEFAGGAVRAVRQVEQLCEDERDRTREVAKLRLISSLGTSAQRRFTKEQLQTTHNVTQRVRAVCLCPHSSLVNPGLVAVIASAAVTGGCGGVQTVPRRRGTRGRGRTFKTKVGIT